MNRLLLIVSFLLVLISGPARSGSVTLLGVGKMGGGAAPTTGRMLLADGVSFILQTDGISKICLAGGCPPTNNLLLAAGAFKILLVNGLSKMCLAGGC